MLLYLILGYFKVIPSLKLESIKEKFLRTNDGDTMNTLRIELFTLLQNATSIGMALYGGKSILLIEKMQRYYRELVMFNSNGLNKEIKELYKNNFLK